MDAREEIPNLIRFTGYDKISKLIQLQKYDIAEAQLDKMLKEDPDDFSALLLKGICYEARGRLSTAQKVYEEAIRKNPNDERGHFFLGRLLSIEGLNKKKGMEELKKAIELNPNDVEYKAELARVYYHSKDMKKAKKMINESISQDPTNPVVKSVYAVIFNLSSNEMIKEVLKDEPNDDVALNDLAVQYLEEGKYKMALETFEKALSIDPNNTLYQNNYLVAKKADLWFYRPKHLLNMFMTKHGMLKFYLIWFGSIIAIAFIFPPLVFLMILFAIYTWIADPIVDSFVKK